MTQIINQIVSARCSIRPAMMSDLPLMQAALGAPTFPARLPLAEMQRSGRLLAWLERMCQAHAAGTGYLWSIDLKSGAPCIGQVSLFARPQANDWALAFWIAPSAWGKSLAGEAVTAVLESSFHDPRIKTVWAAAAVWNTASLALLRKLGFVEGEQLAAGYLIDGQPEAVITFLLNHA